MRFLFWLIALYVMGALYTFAQDIETITLMQPPDQSEWAQFLESVRGVPGVTWFVISLLAVQGLFLLFRTVVGDVLGIHRLLVLAILSVGATIATNVLSGKTVIESVFLDASTLMAYQVLLHQIKRQWEKRSADDEELELIRRCGVNAARKLREPGSKG